MVVRKGRELEVFNLIRGSVFKVRLRKNLMSIQIKNVRLSIVVASHGIHTYSPNSQSQAVVMEVLSVGGGVIGERGVGKQIITTVPSSLCKQNSFNTSRTLAIRIIVTVELQYSRLVFIVFSPIEELNNDITYKWPMQVIIMFTLHKTRSDCYVSTFGTFIAIHIYIQNHLITTGVCVEWWTYVFVIELLAFGELCECELTH